MYSVNLVCMFLYCCMHAHSHLSSGMFFATFAKKRVHHHAMYAPSNLSPGAHFESVVVGGIIIFGSGLDWHSVIPPICNVIPD